MGAEVGVKLRANVDGRRLAGGVLHHEEELGDYLDDVSGLEDKVALPLDGLGGEAARDVGLGSQLPRRRALGICPLYLLINLLFDLFLCFLFVFYLFSVWVVVVW